MDYAPVIIFSYNRLNHLKQTIETLSKNKLAQYSELFIFSDGPKNNIDIEKVHNVREYIANIDTNYFKNISVYESDVNLGLAGSIIRGVTQIMSQFGKAIIIEDDVLTSIDFLDYMNNALVFFQNNSKIWSISGFSAPMRIPEDYNHDIILIQRTSSCCWATWKDRWDKIDWDVSDYNSFRFNFIKRKLFNQYGKDRSSMLDDQMNGRISSWAIRFEYAMWKNDMYNISPINSRALNIGNDGSGTHNVNTKNENDVTNIEELYKPIILENINTDEVIRKMFIRRYSCSSLSLFKRFISNALYNKG